MPPRIISPIAVATTVTEVVPAGLYSQVWLYNESDEIIYLDIVGTTQDTLTAANGYPLGTSKGLALSSEGNHRQFENGIKAIHGGSGTKSLRVQYVSK